MELTGYGSGDGSGSGYGYGSGYGSGYGDGNGNGYGDGYGDGNGNGYGDGYGDGNGNGNGNVEIELTKENAWRAFHSVRAVNKVLFRLRDGRDIVAGQYLHENDIEMCVKGLHASLTADDAKLYAPRGSVLTRVLVWGRIKVAEDKLVATDRQIIEVL